MKGWLLRSTKNMDLDPLPLDQAEIEIPRPGTGDLLVEVLACGVCHTELDEIEGRAAPPSLPVIPGHQVVGRVVALGTGASRHAMGARVGVGWFHSACGRCAFCLSGRENLCPDFRATGRDANGGYAEYMTVPEDSAYPIPEGLGDAEAAPLLCAGGVGYRALRLTGLADGGTLGFAGFGASAHLVMQIVRARMPACRVFVFARSESQRRFARELGAEWTGTFDDVPPSPLDAVIDTTPAWKPVLASLSHLVPGGVLVINAIRKEMRDAGLLASLDYGRQLWHEHRIQSVANVTRADIVGCLEIAGEAGIRPEVYEYPLADANRALADLRAGGTRGARVLVCRPTR